MTPAEIMMLIDLARQASAFALQLAGPKMTHRQNAVVTTAVNGLQIVLQSIQQQTDIADVDMATLDAKEVLILAADARAQADAEIRTSAYVADQRLAAK